MPVYSQNNKDEEITALGRVHVTNNVHEKVLNISQDIMARVTHVPLPKHIGLALHVLRQTRSSDLIQILNRFGHSINYDEHNDMLHQWQRRSNFK